MDKVAFISQCKWNTGYNCKAFYKQVLQNKNYFLKSHCRKMVKELCTLDVYN